VTQRRRRSGRLLRLGAFGAAAAATVALTQVPASGAFSGVDGNAANRVASAASFCTAPPSTLSSTGDSWTDESNDDDNHQNDLELRVRSSAGGDRHVWIGFALPAAPTNCGLTQAKLALYNKTPATGRFIDVYRGNPGPPLWTVAGITWSNEPGYTGTAATTAATTNVPGWQEWNVTAHVVAQYAGGVNAQNGFLLRDRAENSGTPREQVYHDRQDTTYRPTLALTWG
jgi:hypothetical protein